jgi:hypothetical protein
MSFQCSICEEASTRICVSCTKDTCRNHLCEKCLSCSDCCTCEVPLEETPVVRDRLGYDLAAESEPVTL